MQNLTRIHMVVIGDSDHEINGWNSEVDKTNKFVINFLTKH